MKRRSAVQVVLWSLAATAGQLCVGSLGLHGTTGAHLHVVAFSSHLRVAPPAGSCRLPAPLPAHPDRRRGERREPDGNTASGLRHVSPRPASTERPGVLATVQPGWEYSAAGFDRLTTERDSAPLTGPRLTAPSPGHSITPSPKRTCVLDVDPSPGGPRLPCAGSSWEDPGLAYQALQEPARPVPRLHSGGGGAVPGNRRPTRGGLRLHREGELSLLQAARTGQRAHFPESRRGEHQLQAAQPGGRGGGHRPDPGGDGTARACAAAGL